MARAARTLAAAAPAAVVIAVAWLRLEEPEAALWRVAALVALGLAAATPPRRWLRAIASLVAALLAARLAFGLWLVPHRLDPGSGFGLATPFHELGASFSHGFVDFYATHLPFAPVLHAEMEEIVLAAVFCFALLVALLAAARLPVAAALALLVGAGWPATLLGPARGIEVGAAILAAGLVLLALLGSRRVPALALPAAAAVIGVAVVVGAAAAPAHGLVRWQSWNPLADVEPVSLGFVWNAQYGGLDWPRRRTVVLDVQSRKPPHYLRAAVLDDFSDDAWQMAAAPGPADALEPAAALRPQNQTRETVTVRALSDTHLVGGSTPIRFTNPSQPRLITDLEPGFSIVPSGLRPGLRYTAWSYTPHPTAAELRRAPPRYPRTIREDGMLDVDAGSGVAAPPFGSDHRGDDLALLFAEDPGLRAYRPLADLAAQVTSGARTPYDAVEDLDNWFLYAGGFAYSDHPPVGDPPLVGFVTRTHSGYCQYFAGAMALMLRYLGIPSRVAVGFWGGRYDRKGHDWVVTDHDAHAWVEVWFRGYGWLPFDPTPPAPGSARNPVDPLLPGRGGAPAQAAGGSQPAVNRSGGGGGTGKPSSSDFHHHLAGPPLVLPGEGGWQPGRGTIALLVVLALAAGAAAVAAAKTVLRFARGRAREPRRIASACREHLAGFLLDQRIETARSATLAELDALLRRELGVEATAFVSAATVARFGPDEHAGPAAREARRELRKLLRAIRRSLTRRERLLGLLSLRSLASRRPTASPVGGVASPGTAL